SGVDQRAVQAIFTDKGKDSVFVVFLHLEESLRTVSQYIAQKSGGTPQAVVGKLQRPAVLRDGGQHEIAVALQAVASKLQRIAILRDGGQHEIAVALQAVVGILQRPAILRD